MNMLLKTSAKNLVGPWKKENSNLSEIETFCAFPYTTSCIVTKKNFILPISLYVPVISGYINEKKIYHLATLQDKRTVRNNLQHFLTLLTIIPGLNIVMLNICLEISL